MKRFFFLISFLLTAQASRADFINLLQTDQCASIMEMNITDSLITVKLEIGSADFPVFADLIPDSLFLGGFRDDDKNERIMRFMRTGLKLQGDKTVLKGKISVWEYRKPALRAALSGASAGMDTTGEKVIYVEISYPVQQFISRLTVTPPGTNDSTRHVVGLCMAAFHKSVPVNDPAPFLESLTLNLNADDPWYSYFDSPAFVRHHSSSVMAFLYIEPYEVRYEVLLRIKDIEKELDLNYGIDDLLDAKAQKEIKRRLSEFIMRHSKIEIDSVPVEPIEEKINFVEINLSGIQNIERPVAYGSAVAGIIQVFPDEGIPNAVNIYWDFFNEKVRSIPVVSVDPSGPWPYELSPQDSIVKWTNFLKHYTLPTVSAQKQESVRIRLPIPTLLFSMLIIFFLIRFRLRRSSWSTQRKILVAILVVATIVLFPIKHETTVPFLKKTSYSQPEAKQLIQELLKNTYRAFDFRNEEDVYDRLAVCNDSALLQELYLQMRESMVLENQGSLEAKVEEVLVTSAEPVTNEGEGLAFRCSWIVKGVVGHWGHKHQRINRYDAVIKIKPINGVWKMYETDILEEVRL